MGTATRVRSVEGGVGFGVGLSEVADRTGAGLVSVGGRFGVDVPGVVSVGVGVGSPTVVDGVSDGLGVSLKSSDG